MYDVAIDKNGKFILNTYDFQFTTDLPSYAAQSLQIQLRTFLGEWYLNTKVGVAYFKDIFGKGQSFVMMEADIKNQILSNSFVKSLNSITVSYDNTNRFFICTFSATLTDGSTLTTTV
jgi:hypothetical protein